MHFHFIVIQTIKVQKILSEEKYGSHEPPHSTLVYSTGVRISPTLKFVQLHENEINMKQNGQDL